jgi:hypothetical protein
MAIIISQAASKPRKLIPAGTHLAVLVHCIHIGVQPGGMYDPKDQVRLNFELPEERVTYTDKNGVEKDAPAMIGEFYNLTLGTAKKPSKLRTLLETWRGRPITDQEAKSLDLAKFLGKAAMVGVVHKESNGNTYANISAVMACPKSAAAGISNEGGLVEYSPDAHDEEMWSLVPQWLREKIEGRIRKEVPAAAAPKATGPMDHPAGVPFDDEIPFGNDERGVISTNPAF